ncbi:MAG: TonB-dependent receptor [Bacteroidales bacterium]|nr:TonB-dependent receptor [Candidatus Cacconaster merdequi]
MKKLFLSGLFFFSALIAFAASIDLQLNNVTVEKAIVALKQKANYSIVLNSDEVDLTKIISVNAKNASIDDVMKQILSGQNVSYSVKGNKITVAKAAPQSRAIVKNYSGVVVDQNGDPVVGAGIVSAEDRNIGTITDIDGKWSLRLASGTKLIISSIGYETKEVTVGENTVIDIVLDTDFSKLEESVVVGFASMKKVNLTGSVAAISGDELQERPVLSAKDALQGLVPGLNITQTSGLLDASATIDIRGTGTIGSGSTAKPLVLIDGAEGDLDLINPQDIESISVLKDAAASSIYGSRAPFGVILVTTKKGQSGRSIVNYNNNIRLSSPTIVPDVMSSYDFCTFVNDAMANSNQGRWAKEEAMQRMKDYINGKIKTVSVPDPSNPQYWASGWNMGNANVDMYQEYYKRHSFSQEHNVSASGGNESVSYYIGFGYIGENGLLKVADDKMDKFTPTARLDAKLTNWLTLNYSVRYVRTKYDRPLKLHSGLYNDWARQSWPTMPAYDDNGYIYQNNGILRGLVEGGDATTITQKLTNHANLSITPIKNWVTNVDFNYNVESIGQNDARYMEYSHDVQGNPYIRSQESYIQEQNTKMDYLNVNAYSTYDFNLGLNNFRVMGGFQYEDQMYRYSSLRRDGLIVPELTEVDLTSGTNYDGTPATPQVSGNSKEWSTAGFFGRLNYDYDGRYLIEANLRYDGSSRFRAENRWHWFPSVSVGWNITKEAFMAGISNTVNLLKIRASYGSLGNQNTDSWYPTYQVINVKTNSGNWIQGGNKTNVAESPALISSSMTWETVNSWNVGFDFAFFNNRLSGTFDWYSRKTLNMVGPAMELPATLGTAVPKSNNTDLKTDGFEFEIGWRDQLSNGLAYSAKFVLSDSKTVITRYPNENKLLSTYYEGGMLGDIWGYESLGIARSNEIMEKHLASMPNGAQNSLGSNWAAGDIMYKDLNGDGRITSGANTLKDHGDMKLLGNSTPRFMFGLDLGAQWKGFDLRMFFQGVAKRDYWPGSYAFWGCDGTNMWYIVPFENHLDYFREKASNDLPANLDALYPRPVLNSKNHQKQDLYMQNAAYIRLKNLTFGYTLPQAWTRKANIEKLRVFYSGENLWTGTKLSSIFDPENINGNASSGVGYPIMKTSSFGLSITF